MTDEYQIIWQPGFHFKLIAVPNEKLETDEQKKAYIKKHESRLKDIEVGRIYTTNEGIIIERIKEKQQ